MQLMKTLVITLITALCALFFMRAAPAEVVSIWDKDLRAPYFLGHPGFLRLGCFGKR